MRDTFAAAPARAGTLAGVAVAVLLHAAVIVALLQYAPVREALRSAVPLMVSLITPPAPKPEVAPKPLPVKPVTRAQPLRPPPPAPVLAAAADAPAAERVVPPPEPAPVETAPAPVTAPVVSLPPAPPPPKPLPLTPPLFNAAYLDNPPPQYPALARRQSQHGTVLLRVFVGADGGAQRVEVRSSSGHEPLDRAAREAVLRWRFVPARQGEQPVAAWVLVPITFTLEG